MTEFYVEEADPLVAYAEDDWVPVTMPGVKAGYLLSRSGEVVSPRGQKVVSGQINKQIYVALQHPDKMQSRSVRLDNLVLETFGPPRPADNAMPVHEDGDARNCHLDNLRWGTPKEAREAVKDSPTLPPPAKRRRKQALAKGTTKAKISKSALGYDDIEVLYTYRHKGTGLSITVDAEGRGKAPKTDLSAEEWRVMAMISARITEMNALMGK